MSYELIPLDIHLIVITMPNQQYIIHSYGILRQISKQQQLEQQTYHWDVTQLKLAHLGISTLKNRMCVLFFCELF